MPLQTRNLTSVGGQLVMVAVLATGVFSSASPINGTLNISGTQVVSLLANDFVPPPGPPNGQVVVLPGGNTGDFAFLNVGISTGLVVDRDPSQQAGIPLNIPNWLTVPNFSFTLRFIRPGSFSSTECFDPPANQQNCTPPPFDPDGPGPLPPILSPYNLTNVIDASGNRSAMSFFVRGTVTNLLNPLDTGNFEGEISATLLNITYQDILNTVLAGGTQPAPFTATLTVTPIPEPSSIAMFLSGAAMLGACLLRRGK